MYLTARNHLKHDCFAVKRESLQLYLSLYNLQVYLSQKTIMNLQYTQCKINDT